MIHINQDIYQYLISRREQILRTFQSADVTINRVRDQLDLLSLDNVKFEFYQELESNCKKYWLEAIEPVDGIIFEYGYIYDPDPEAVAYGIILTQENSFKLQPEPYSFGYAYDFAALFEAVPGITLSVLNPLSEHNDLHNMENFEDIEN